MPRPRRSSSACSRKTARRSAAWAWWRLPAAAASGSEVRSPETYVGYARAKRFASFGMVVRDASHDYRLPALPSLNSWGLAGAWSVGAERAVLDKPGGRIAFRFHARDLHLVLGPSADGRPIPFTIRIDGKAPGKDHGVDTDENGRGRVTEQRLYQLVRQHGPIADRGFEIEFDVAGAQAYAFTFG